MAIRKFHFERIEDVSGVSGCGRVAEGCIFTDTGETIVHWLGEHASTTHYSSIKDAEFIHSHGGKTKIVFDDPEESLEDKKE